MKKYFVLLFVLTAISLFAVKTPHKVYDNSKARLSIEKRDVFIEKLDENTYDIYVRVKGDVKSVMLVHTETIDGEYYNLRSFEHNDINSDEKRILNGEFIPQEKKLYFILDSKPEAHSVLGEAYKLRLKTRSVVGYPYNGTEQLVTIKAGSKINIRTFNRPYGDYDGYYKDNIFTLEADEKTEYEPRLKIDHVEKKGDYHSLYITFSGGDKRKRKFYLKDSAKSANYENLPVLWGDDKDDSIALLLNDYFDDKTGKTIRIKAYFKTLPKDRELFINIFDEEGETETPPVRYLIEGKGEIPPIEEPITETPKKEEPKAKEGFKIRDDVVSEFQKIADLSDGNVLVATSPEDVPDKIEEVIEETKGGDIDFVFVIDDTGSMKDDMDAVKARMSELMKKLFDSHDETRVALVLYRDYSSSFLTRVYEFTKHPREFVRILSLVSRTQGGGDDPEAVYEGIETALSRLNYQLEKRVILVLGDAPPRPRSPVNIKSLMEQAKRMGINVRLFAVAVPDEKDK